MVPAVVLAAVAANRPPLLTPAMRDELIPHVTRLLEYLLHTAQPIAGVAAGHLVECATILGRLALLLIALS